MDLLYGNIILLLFVLIELGYIHFYRKEPVDFKEVSANINSGHILLFIFRSLGLAVYFYVWDNFAFGFTDRWPDWVIWLFCIFAWDFCYYWSHRLHHHITFLWFVHQVHHQGEHFNLSLGLRNSWYSTLTSLPFFLLLAFFGIPLEIFVTISAIHYFIQFLNHSHLIRKIPWVEMIFITPSDHRVHHGKNEPYLNKNFGGSFVVWDKMFGTFQPENDEVPVKIGIPNWEKTSNTLFVNNRVILNRFFPKSKFKEEKYSTPAFLILSSCLLFFGLLCCFLFAEKTISGTEKILFFILIFLGTIANGELSDGKIWGIRLCLMNDVIFSAVYLIIFPNTMMVQVILMSLLMINALVVILFNFATRMPLLRS